MTSGTFLDRILPRTREDLEQRKQRVPQDGLEAWLDQAPAPQDFTAALAAPGLSLIAEVKRASPSKGTFVEKLDVAALVRNYAKNGAAAISVLTDTPFFQGSLDDMATVRTVAAMWHVPVLRKDFIIDPYQVFEARTWGADALLLIVAVLEQQELTELIALTRKIGMEALVEVHTVAEVERAVAADARVIGINNRDLSTFATNLQTTADLIATIPADKIVISESGISTAADVQRLEALGARGILVGEALITAPDTATKVQELSGRDSPVTPATFSNGKDDPS